MIYTPKTTPVHAFQYGRDKVPQWLKNAAKLEPGPAVGPHGRLYLTVTPEPDINLTGPRVVYTGEFIVLQPDGGLFFYETEEQFLYLLFTKTQEE